MKKIKQDSLPMPQTIPPAAVPIESGGMVEAALKLGGVIRSVTECGKVEAKVKKDQKGSKGDDAADRRNGS